MNRHLLRAAAGALLTATSAAQISSLDLSSTTSASETVAPLGGPFAYEEVAVGDLDGNLDPDVVYTVGPDVVVFMNVTVSTASFLLGHPANDVAVVTRSTGQDVLVLADDAGLLVVDLSFDYAGQSVVPTPFRIGGVIPGGLSKIVVAQLDGEDGLDVIGLGGGGSILYGYLETPGAPGGFAGDPALTAATSATAWDLTFAELTPGVSSIVTLGPSGLHVYDRFGQSVTSYPYGALRGAMATISGSGRDDVAWFRPGPEGEEMVLVSGFGEGTPTTVTERIVAADTGDIDFDGDEDLVLSVDDAHELQVVENTGVGFGSTPVRLFNDSPSSTGNHAAPIVADLDHDGRDDVAMVDHSTDVLNVFLNDEYPEYQTLVPDVEYLDFAGVDEVEWNFYGYSGGHPEVPFGATHLSLRVFNQHPDPSLGWTAPFSDALPFETQLVRLFTTTAATFPLAGPNAITTPEPDYVTYVEARFVRLRQGDAAILAKLPPYWFGIVSENNTPAILYMAEHFPNDIFTADQLGNGESVGGGAGPPPATPPGPGGG